MTELACNGFTKIELSGGTKYYDGFVDDLLELKAKYGLEYRCHNYFPPPSKNFVLNLSSVGSNFKRSLNHLKLSLKLSHLLGASEFGMHAGFRIDPRTDEMGRKIAARQLSPYDDAVSKFFLGLNELNGIAEELKVTLYVENNVFSDANKKSFQGENPFLLTSAQEYKELCNTNPFNLLLDVAHLKVSCYSLGLDFSQQLAQLLNVSRYVHISDNDGLKDANQPLKMESELYGYLKSQDLENKTFTLEVYSGLSDIEGSFEALKSAIAN